MLLKLVKGMDDISIQAMLWKLQRLKHASQRLEDILYEEQELRKDKDKDKLEFI